MDSVSSTAADAPFMAAAVTAGSIPCTAPHTSAAVTISVHTRPIAMRCASSPAPAAGHIFLLVQGEYAPPQRNICGNDRAFGEEQLTEFAKYVILKLTVNRIFGTTE